MKIIIGTANFNRKYGIKNKFNPDIKEQKKFYHLQKKNKIKFLDYSNDYIDLKNFFYRNFKINLKFKLSSKKIRVTKDVFIKEIINILKKIKLKKVDTLMFHRSSDLTRLDKNELESLIKYLKNFFCKNIGLSIYKTSDFDKLKKKFNPDILQCPFNLLNNDILKNNWLNNIRKRGIKIHVRSIFLQGLLLLDLKDIPNKLLRYNNIFKKIENFSNNLNKSKLEICINHVKKYNKQIDGLVLGVQSTKQLKEIIYYLKKKNLEA